MPNELRCCPECGSTEFSWITEYIERGHVIDEGDGPGYREPRGMMEPAHGSADYGIECSLCTGSFSEADLISQDEAYNDPELSRDWMMDYTPEDPGQDTLSDE